jgi:hypothetical protein
MTGSGQVGDLFPGWSVTEGVSPITVDGDNGTTGSVTLGAVAYNGDPNHQDSRYIQDNLATFSANATDMEGVAVAPLGGVTGYIDGVSIVGSGASFGIVPLLNLLSGVTVTAPPTGQQNLSTIFAAYVALAANSGLTVNYTAASDPLRIYPGWSGDLWTMLNQLAAVNRVELALVGAQLVVRDIGLVMLSLGDNAAVTPSWSNAATGLAVSTVCQNTSLVSVLGATQMNWSQNPSLETNTTGWTAALSSTYGTINSTIRASGSTFVPGESFWLRALVATTTGAVPTSNLMTITHTIDVSTAPVGTVFNYSMGVGVTSAASANVRRLTANISATWNTGASAVASKTGPRTSISNAANTSLGTVTGTTTAKPVGALTITFTITSGTDNGQRPPGSAAMPLVVGDALYADAFLLTDGSFVPYFDGNSAGCAWLGSTNNSPSTKTLGTIVPFYDALKDNNTNYSVKSGEVAVTTIQTNNYPTMLAQPTQSNFFPVTAGQYYVSGQDNLPIPSGEWAAFGGSVTVAIGDVPGTIQLTLTGPPAGDIPGVPGPYSLAASDGTNSFAQLSIAGIGVVTNPQTITWPTGANPASTTVAVASSVNCPFVIDIPTAYSTLAWSSSYASGPVATITGNIPTAQLLGFGLTSGALVTWQGAVYRISDLTIGKVVTSFNAIWYNTCAAQLAAFPTQTAAQHAALWAGYSASDAKIAPLRAA